MYRLLTILPGILLTAACAAPVVSPEPSVSSEASIPAPASEATEKTIEVAKIPEPSAAPSVVLNRNERICRNERRTGTNRVVRVCRTAAEMAQLEAQSKEVFNELHRSQKEYE